VDKEHTLTSIGQTSYPKEDERDSLESYEEKFLGRRTRRFPYNNSLISNTTPPLLVGWVGELNFHINEISSFLYSFIYASPQFAPDAFTTRVGLQLTKLKMFTGVTFLNSFFNQSTYQLTLYS
jgi:hypothetical protein